MLQSGMCFLLAAVFLFEYLIDDHVEFALSFGEIYDNLSNFPVLNVSAM